MNKSKVKNNIETIRGRKIHFKYNGSRNQVEEFDGIIENTYNSVFTIKLEDKESVLSFTYNDVINESLQIFI